MLSVLNNLEFFEPGQDAAGAEARRRLARTRQSAREALEAVRDLCARLRGSADPEPGPPERWAGPRRDRRAGIDSRTAYRQLFFVLREAVHNAVAHSRAKRIKIDFILAADRITAVIEDDGDGFEPRLLPPAQRIGLDSMSERTALLGGSFDIVSGPRQGTRVSLVLPVRGAPGEHG